MLVLPVEVVHLIGQHCTDRGVFSLAASCKHTLGACSNLLRARKRWKLLRSFVRLTLSVNRTRPDIIVVSRAIGMSDDCCVDKVAGYMSFVVDGFFDKFIAAVEQAFPSFADRFAVIKRALASSENDRADVLRDASRFSLYVCRYYTIPWAMPV